MVKPYVSQQPIDDFSLAFSDNLYNAALTSGANTILTVPSTAARYKAVIKVTQPTWIAYNHTASSPVSSAFTTTYCELIVSSQDFCREVVSASTLNFFSVSSSANISVGFYSFQTV